MSQEDALTFNERVRVVHSVMGLVDAGEIGTVVEVECGYFYLVQFGDEESGKVVTARLSLSELARV